MAYTAIPLQMEDHREVLLELWKRNFPSPRMEESADKRFMWLYHSNPLGAAQTWLAVDSESNAVIGCGSVFPLNKYVRGRAVRTGVSIDFAVDEKHRGAWAALAIQRAVTRGSRPAGCDCVIGQPNRQAFPVFNLVGYRPIGDASNWVKPLDTDDNPREQLRGSYVDEIVGAADERFDQLWHEYKPDSLILAEKTADYLNWRYAAFTGLSYRFYCLLRRTDRQLAGYVAFSAMENGVFIADLFCEDLFGPVLHDLLLGFESRMRLEGQEWIGLAYLGTSAFEDHLRQLGFSQRKRRRSLLAFVDVDVPCALRNQIFDKNSSLVFGGEMDLF